MPEFIERNPKDNSRSLPYKTANIQHNTTKGSARLCYACIGYFWLSMILVKVLRFLNASKNSLKIVPIV